MKTERKEYNPMWPFPQYDEDGKQLLPPDWNKRESQYERAARDAEGALL